MNGNGSLSIRETIGKHHAQMCLDRLHDIMQNCQGPGTPHWINSPDNYSAFPLETGRTVLDL